MPSLDFLPRGLRGLLDYISPAAFDVVNWQAVLKQVPGLTKRLMLHSGRDELIQNLSRHLPPGVTIPSKSSPTHASDTSKLAAKARGQQLLELYFVQIFHSSKVFLDLRAERFHYADDSHLQWHPSGLWVEFSTSFSENLRRIYDGFYQDDQEKLHVGLLEIGLLSNSLSEPSKNKLLQLLEDNFGAGKSGPVRLTMKGFMKSFDDLFCFLRDEKISLHEDFMYLGILLVTLYLHLDKLDTELDVLDAYQSSS